jgi:hypothetical protein
MKQLMARKRAAGLLLAAAMLAGCSTAAGTATSASAPATTIRATPATGWIIGAYTFATLRANGASASLISAAFGNDRSYVFGPPVSPIGVPAITFQSYQAIKAAFASHQLPGRYRAVMYDNERWPLTPLAEQQHPGLYEHLAASLVHQHGMLFISAPAPDITLAAGTQVDHSTQATYLERDIAGGAARYADVIDIQAQYLEPHLSEFVAFATAAARQARQANPDVQVFIGIATGPDGQAVTAQQLYAAYQAMLPVADGYWLNISGHSNFCLGCTAPRPQLAVDLLVAIYETGRVSSRTQDK